MRALLDINVLIALLDQDHSMHRRATDWFRVQVEDGWASCPLTQNGCVRIMSNAGYRNPLPVPAVMARLREAVADPHHAFWPDSVSLLDERVANASRIHGPRQLTDLYLLALAVRHSGMLVTFDAGIVIGAVAGATAHHLLAL